MPFFLHALRDRDLLNCFFIKLFMLFFFLRLFAAGGGGCLFFFICYDQSIDGFAFFGQKDLYGRLDLMVVMAFLLAHPS